MRVVTRLHVVATHCVVAIQAQRKKNITSICAGVTDTWMARIESEYLRYSCWLFSVIASIFQSFHHHQAKSYNRKIRTLPTKLGVWPHECSTKSKISTQQNAPIHEHDRTKQANRTTNRTTGYLVRNMKI